MRGIIDSSCTKTLCNSKVAQRIGAVTKTPPYSMESTGPSGEKIKLDGLATLWVQLRGRNQRRRIEVAVTSDLSEEDGFLLSGYDCINLGLISIHLPDGDVSRDEEVIDDETEDEEEGDLSKDQW